MAADHQEEEDMTKEQYRKANGAVFPVVVIILGYLSLSLVLFFLASAGNATWKSWLQLITFIAALIVAIVGYVTQKETKTGAIIMLGSVAVAYAVFSHLEAILTAISALLVV